MNNTYIASDFQARMIPVRELQTDDEIMSDDCTIVKVSKRPRAKSLSSGGKVVKVVGTELLLVHGTSTVRPTATEYGINETVLLLSRRPEPDFVAESV